MYKILCLLLLPEFKILLEGKQSCCHMITTSINTCWTSVVGFDYLAKCIHNYEIAVCLALLHGGKYLTLNIKVVIQFLTFDGQNMPRLKEIEAFHKGLRR